MTNRRYRFNLLSNKTFPNNVRREKDRDSEIFTYAMGFIGVLGIVFLMGFYFSKSFIKCDFCGENIRTNGSNFFVIQSDQIICERCWSHIKDTNTISSTEIRLKKLEDHVKKIEGQKVGGE